MNTQTVTPTEVVFAKANPGTYTAEWATGTAVIHKRRGAWVVITKQEQVYVGASLKESKGFITRRLAAI